MPESGCTDYDLVIVGAGMVGASLACALLPGVEKHGLKIALVEAWPLKADAYQPSYDDRCTALSYGSAQIYRDIGVWPEIEQHLTAIKQIHVSDQGSFGAARINAGQAGVEALGYVVENRRLGAVLLDRISRQPGIDLICPASAQAVDLQQGRPSLALERDGEQLALSANLVVIADGGQSGLAAELQLGVEQKHYQQHAIIANLSSERPHHNLAYERFTEHGPVALLPLSEADSPNRNKSQNQSQNRYSLVFTVPAEDADTYLEMDDARFLSCLQDSFGYRQGCFIKIGKRAGYPLSLALASEQIRSGLVVMGNAAHRLHPIAGQGYNLALRGVQQLAQLLLEASRHGQNPGELKLLQHYLQLRQADQAKTVGFTDKTLKLFSNRDLLLRLARSAGLVTLDLLPVAKRQFARQAMGVAAHG